MSRILRRPMFRGGRIESKGDLKVIDQMGIQNLAVGGRVGYDMGGEIEDYTDIIEAVRKSRPQKKGLSTSDYLRIASAGAEILGAPSEGSGIMGAFTSAAKPLANLGTNLATSMDARNLSEEEAITDISGAIMKSRNYRPDRGFALTKKLEDLEKFGKEKQNLTAVLEDPALLVSYITENNIEGETDAEKLTNAKVKINNRLEIINSALRVLEPKDEYLLAFLKSGRAGQFWNTMIQAEVKAQQLKSTDPKFDWNKVIIRASSGQKDGGLTTGYANGGLTAAMSEEVITPQGGEMMEEEVVEETPAAGSSAPLTFEQLRQRLPKEIPDDVIRLLASSDEALLEFSNIATQQDVDEFNVKYGVELVLPQV